MTRAIVNFKINDGLSYVNIEADRFEQTSTHLMVCKGNNIVGTFTWESVITAYISEKSGGYNAAKLN